MDAYPYFQTTQSNSIQNGPGLFQDALSATQAAVGAKPVWVTETGWPVSGSTANLAVPNPANAKTYWDAVGCPLFGKTNTWWYTLTDNDAVQTNPSFGLVPGNPLSTTPYFDLSCSAVSSSSSSPPSSTTSTGNTGSSASSAGSVISSSVSSVISVATNSVLASYGGGLSPSQGAGNGIGSSGASGVGAAPTGTGTGSSGTGSNSTATLKTTASPTASSTSTSPATATANAASHFAGSVVGAICALIVAAAAL
jgi:glucan endo-1,3-beta-D-glucosidase